MKIKEITLSLTAMRTYGVELSNLGFILRYNLFIAKPPEKSGQAVPGFGVALEVTLLIG